MSLLLANRALIGEDIPPAELIAYYPFNGNANDESGNELDGTLVGSPSLVTPQNNALNLGSGKSMSVSDNDLLSFTDGVDDKPFSFAFKIKGEPVATTAYLFQKRGSTTQTEYQIIYADSIGLQLVLFGSGGTSSYIFANTTGFTLDPATEYNVVITYDGSGLSTGINIFVDGINETTIYGDLGTYNGMDNGISPLRIGVYSGGNYWDGYLDEIKIYNNVLSS